MFQLTKVAAIPGGSGDILKIEVVPGDGGVNWPICFVETWGFNSCAVLNLRSFRALNSELSKKFSADDFFAFLREVHKPSWAPREAYFLVSDTQLKSNEWLKKIVRHPNVKRKDRFENKAHGPNHVHLFRWSDKHDFERVRRYV